MINKKVSSEIAVGIILLLSLIVGGIFYFQKNTENFNIAGAPKIIEAENKSSIQPVKPNLADSTQAPKSRFAGTNCYAKTSDGIDDPYELSKDFNKDEPTEKIPYVNNAKGISFDIPFNPNWGNENCKVETYVEFAHPSGNIVNVSFGRINNIGEGGFSLAIRSHRNAEDIIKEQNNNDNEPDPNPRKMTIGGNDVIAYESYGVLNERIYEVIGKDYNYSFSYGRFAKINEARAKELEKIIEGVRIVSNKQISIGDWKKFTNSDYKFEIQYPSSYIFNETSNQDGAKYRILFGPSGVAVRNVDIIINNNKKGLDSFMKESAQRWGGIEHSSENIGIEKIAGVDAKIVKVCNMGGGCSKDILFARNNNVYTIHMVSYFSTEVEGEKIIFDKMISSLRFIN